MRLVKAIRAAMRRSRSSMCNQRPGRGWPERSLYRCGLPRGHDGVCRYYREDGS